MPTHLGVGQNQDGTIKSYKMSEAWEFRDGGYKWEIGDNGEESASKQGKIGTYKMARERNGGVMWL